jgi:hypothetical protein
VICLQLAGGKAQQLGKAKGLQIVRPQWVLDCVKRGRLLPESQYAVIKSATQAVPVKNSILSFLNNSKDKSMR